MQAKFQQHFTAANMAYHVCHKETSAAARPDHPMIPFADLLEIAHKRERTASRRLAKRQGMTPETALQQTLETAAGPHSLTALIASRRQEKAMQLAALAARRQQKTEARAQKARAMQPDPASWLAWFDGATHPNPGKMGIGGVLRSPAGALTEISFMAGLGDSSEAEYLALIAVLQAALAVRAEKLLIHGDSRVVLDDVQAQSGAPALRTQREQARQLLAQLAAQATAVTLRWIPRHRNAAADALSQRAVRMQA
jgi:ribonuclease HI